jgi:hypothetical protein
MSASRAPQDNGEFQRWLENRHRRNKGDQDDSGDRQKGQDASALSKSRDRPNVR